MCLFIEALIKVIEGIGATLVHERLLCSKQKTNKMTKGFFLKSGK